MTQVLQLGVPLLLQIPANGSVSLSVRVALSVSAVLWQAHSLDRDVRLGTDAVDFEQGRHIGFVDSLAGLRSTSNAVVRRAGGEAGPVLLWATGLNSSQPVPGGCALVTTMAQVPTIRHEESEGLVRVEWSPPGLSRSRLGSVDTCQSFATSAGSYHYTVLARLVGEDAAEALLSFANASQASNSGYVVRRFSAAQTPPVLRMANVPGRGVLVTVVVEGPRGSAAYVPALHTGDSDTQGFSVTSTAAKVTAGVAVALGLVLALLGHRSVHYGQLNVGWLLGSLLTTPLLWSFKPDWLQHKSDVDLLLLGLALGSLGGLALLILWESTGQVGPVAVSSSLLSGFLVTISAAYFGLDGWEALHGRPVARWVAFGLVWALATLAPLTSLRWGLPLSTAVTGAAVAAAGLSFVVGGTLHFVLIRAVQRFVLPAYQAEAYFFVPFTETDGLLTGGLAVVVVLGVGCQAYLTRHWPEGRPPKPRKCCRRPRAFTRPPPANPNEELRLEEWERLVSEEPPSYGAATQPSAPVLPVILDSSSSGPAYLPYAQPQPHEP